MSNIKVEFSNYDKILDSQQSKAITSNYESTFFYQSSIKSNLSDLDYRSIRRIISRDEIKMASKSQMHETLEITVPQTIYSKTYMFGFIRLYKGVRAHVKEFKQS